MKISAHMQQRERFRRDSRAGQIIGRFDERFFAGRPDELRLEWAPTDKVAHSDGFKFRHVRGNGHRLMLKVAGEPKYTLGFPSVSKETEAAMSAFLCGELDIKEKRRCKDMKKSDLPDSKPSNGGQPSNPPNPPAPPPPPAKEKKPEKTAYISNSLENRNEIWVAIQTLVEESGTPVGQWAEFKDFNARVMDLAGKGIAGNPISANSLNAILQRLVKEWKCIELERKKYSSTVRIRALVGRGQAKAAPSQAQLPDAPSLARFDLSQLLTLNIVELGELQAQVKANANLAKALEFLLQK